jgi:hypothetical protein
MKRFTDARALAMHNESEAHKTAMQRACMSRDKKAEKTQRDALIEEPNHEPQ